MPSAYALGIVSGNCVLNFGVAERLRALRYSFFHRWGRDGKRQLQRRFLRKRGAADIPDHCTQNKKPSLLHFCINDGFVLERPTRLELATSTLARWRSTR